jgi:hypothetical protein
MLTFMVHCLFLQGSYNGVISDDGLGSKPIDQICEENIELFMRCIFYTQSGSSECSIMPYIDRALISACCFQIKLWEIIMEYASVVKDMIVFSFGGSLTAKEEAKNVTSSKFWYCR